MVAASRNAAAKKRLRIAKAFCLAGQGQYWNAGIGAVGELSRGINSGRIVCHTESSSVGLELVKKPSSTGPVEACRLPPIRKKNANGRGTDRLCRVGSEKSQFSGRFLECGSQVVQFLDT